ncbi:hypothetical protein DVA67_002430 [Solirubrobacter sp. CPCC 204708]|uniref:Uncharacterized protein n=1 Tax=Solirubrobacter deserti TaxID=2282478 RepID=A0ABT4RRV5_9ACTN|nr:hypothetical protein [Solirubrobacter deserti]MBE2314817.1 hypothetical protein [Solirubrobacter deserti]MDA0141227.1 hypothetical protein [Solirubrobacter deserti]
MGFEGDAYLFAVALVGAWLLAVAAIAALAFLRPSRAGTLVLGVAAAAQLAMLIRAATVQLWPLVVVAALALVGALAVWRRWRVSSARRPPCP